MVAAAQAADPFVRNNQPVAAAEEQQDDHPKYVSICYEAFSLPLADAATLRREGLPDAALYLELVKRTEGGTVNQEHFAILCSRSGEKAMLENISEQIYPTEYEPGSAALAPTPAPEPAAADGSKPAAQPAPAPAAAQGPLVPALPTSFETRNTGFTLEVEATIGGNSNIIDMRFAPDFVNLVDRVKFGQGASETEMPTFESQRLTTALTLKSGVPMMIGTPSRPLVSKLDPDSAKKVWFAFITATVVKVPR